MDKINFVVMEMFCILIVVVVNMGLFTCRNSLNCILRVDFIRYKLCLIKKRTSWGFPGGPVVENPPAGVGDTSLIPGLGRCPD